uniref:Plastid lipid-associated protein/fibrillin conserved domain-containing protein n=1 Tax=Octactis speculum TaxID=3111310 RepID=A0A7S2C572_9STRA|mmetsp:Transcript_3111/g.3530  ORF Transcript_3111/g.3530 Transcript_3111/m.3530 type:complete len:485 (+) Transcript_3111:43-1497(+)
MMTSRHFAGALCILLASDSVGAFLAGLNARPFSIRSQNWRQQVPRHRVWRGILFGATNLEIGLAEEGEIIACYEAAAAKKGDDKRGVSFDDLVDLPDLRGMLLRGELEQDEVKDIWTKVVQDSPQASANQFVQIWKELGDLFEFDDTESEIMVDDPIELEVYPDNEVTNLEGECVASWTEAKGGSESDSTVSKASVLACKFITEPLEDGDLSPEEVEELWETAAGDAKEVDKATFARFWEAVEDLFEDESEMGFTSEESKRLRAELVALLAPIGRAGLVTDEDDESDTEILRAKIAELCDQMEVLPEQVLLREELMPDDARIHGTWDLVYTTSPMFQFNEGYTGVAKTTPGGMSFVSLSQRFDYEASDAEGQNAKFVESLKGVRDIPMDVNVDATWELKRRLDLMSTSNEEQVVIASAAQTIQYGPIEVTGDRVKVGWKAMRSLNGASLRVLEPAGEGERIVPGQLRVMHGGSAKSSLFIFKRR